jgi:hypothetical protein
MPQVIIKRNSLRKSSEANNKPQGDEVIITGDQVVVNSESSVTVTFGESDITVDLAE